MRAHRGDNRRSRTRLPGHAGARRIAQRRLSRARLSAAARERQRLANDLHDGVQNELVSLIIGLSLAEEDRDTPPELAAKLSTLGTRAEATLDAIREIGRGNRPPLLVLAGVTEAIGAQAALAPMTVTLEGAAPRSSAEAEQAVYFACLEALQNVVKHVGPSARVTVRMGYRGGRLVVRVVDDGCGFVQLRGCEGAGLTNIRDRLASVGGTVTICSSPGRGTVVAMTLPWPANRQRRPPPARSHG
jgi:signal transduction histidine kinase